MEARSPHQAHPNVAAPPRREAPPGDPRVATLYQIIRHIRPLHRHLARAVEDNLAGTGLTVGLRALLEELDDHGPRTVPQLARGLHLPRQFVQRMANTAASLELIERRPNPAHRRSPLLSLTPAGRQAFAAIRRREDANLGVVAEALRVGDIDAAHLVVHHMTEQFRAIAEHRQAPPARTVRSPGTHPDHHRALDHLETAWAAWARAGSALAPDQWQRPTRLAPWTVHHLFAHHSLGVWLLDTLTRAAPAAGPPTHRDAAALLHDWNRPDGVAHGQAASVAEAAVALAERRRPDALLAELDRDAPAALDRARQADPDRVIDYLGVAAIPFGEALQILVMESVVHYLDLARALGWEVPGPLAGGPLEATRGLLVALADPVDLVESATGRTGPEVRAVLR